MKSMDLSSSVARPDAGTSAGSSTAAGLELLDVEKLLHAFYAIPSIERAWACTARSGGSSLDVLVAMSQINVAANARRTFLSSVYIPDGAENPTSYHWSPFPFELSGALLIVPSPSGSKLLVVRKPDFLGGKDGTGVKLEFWGAGQLIKEILVPGTLHGSVYTDGWFEGVSWSPDEDSIAYVAEESPHPRPVFGHDAQGLTRSFSSLSENNPGSWKGQGEWMEDWGEYYTGKRRPVLFIASLSSGSVQQVEGVPENLSAGQVIWAPLLPSGEAYHSLVFVGWPSHASNFRTPRKLGMKYCYNRPCALYAVAAQGAYSDENVMLGKPRQAIKLTNELSSALSPCFSPDGSLLVFLSAKAAVDSGVHCATNSLHFLQWPLHDVLGAHTMHVKDVVPVVLRPGSGSFPGLYCTNLVSHPWLLDRSTLLLSSCWRSTQVILGVNVNSGKVTRISPADSRSSWTLLAVRNNFVIAAVSTPTTPHCLKLGHNPNMKKIENNKAWTWTDLAIPSHKYDDKVENSITSSSFEILRIPIPTTDRFLLQGAKEPFEAIFVCSKSAKKAGSRGSVCLPPLILVLHGGPHSVSQTTFSRTTAFLSAMGFNLLHVNYRGSLGFGEEALQSLPGNVGSQDVQDVLAALDEVIVEGLADPCKVAILGGSHGGFLASHLLGQAPDRFQTAVLRNPVCNLSSMVGMTDIPDWCYVELYGKDGVQLYTEAPTDKDLTCFYLASPLAHLSNVKVPTFFLLGAGDRRVPISNGFQYVQALRQRGLEVKVLVFPEDIHSIDRPQSEFESFVNIASWFKKFF